ncbi:MAG: hypothetical protein QOJ27_2383 [Sphingomonadales bacterium]|jgi:hypothetical protein|nr:hypothetical protein [Sphingomonadales bacterium]
MRTIALAGLVLALAACGGNDKAADDANALTADNMMTDDNLMLDENAMNATAGVDANGSVNASTANLMEKDATTHDADTNLANGL